MTAKQVADLLELSDPNYTLGNLPEWVSGLINAEVDKEKQRRIYYQDIVYEVCRQLDKAFCRDVRKGEGVVCGCLEHPSSEVQRLMAELVRRDHEAVLAWAKGDAGLSCITKRVMP